jgi:creatinine amidohydrolase
MQQVWIQEMTSRDVEEILQETDMALLPVGSTEQHGPSLPLGVDTFIPMYAVEQIAKKTGVPIVPPIWFAPCEWHMGFSGTITVKPTTFIGLIVDVCRSLRRHGFKNFIIVNGHTVGANPALLTAADEIQSELPDVRVWVADVALMSTEAWGEACEAPVVSHADELEASQMMVARGDLVGPEDVKRLQPTLPDERSRFLKVGYRFEGNDQMLFRYTAEDWRTLAPHGHLGDPTLASEDKGRIVMDALVDNVVAFINDLRSKRPVRKTGGWEASS